MMKKVLFTMLLMCSAGVAFAEVQTTPPVIYIIDSWDYCDVWADGDGEVFLFKDGIAVENPCTIWRTDDVQAFLFEAYAQAEGCLPSERVYEYVEVFPAGGPIIDPPMPDIDMAITDEYAYLVFYYDAGYDQVRVCVNGEPRDYPYIFPRWEEDYDVVIDVCFSAEGFQDFYYSKDFIVPALEGAPHDVNSDGRVNIGDVTALINYLLTQSSEGFNVDKADVDGDGQINIDDITILIDRLLNIPW